MTTTTMVSPTGSRVAGQIRDFVNQYPVKVLASDLSRVLGQTVEPRTVRSWREGATSPGVRHIEGLAVLFGDVFIRHIFAPIIEDEADLPRRLERLELEISAIRRDYNEMANAPASPSDDRDRGMDRPASAAGSGRSGPAAKAARSMGRSLGVMALAVMSGWSTIDSEAMRTTTRSGSRPPITRSVRVARMTAADGGVQA